MISPVTFPRLFAFALVVVTAVLPLQAAPEISPGSAKPKITKLDDLPRHTYPVTGSVVDLVTSAEKFAPFAAEVRANIEKDLTTYDIEDKSTLKSLKGELLTIDLLEGKNDEARKLIGEIRALEEKPAAKIVTGFLTEVRLDAQAQTKQTDLTNPEFVKVFQADLLKRANALPWDVVQDEIKHIKGGFEIRSRNLLLGKVQSEIEPTVKQSGVLSNDLAGDIISIRSALEISIPLKAPVVAALSEVVAAHNVKKPDIWQERAVLLKEGDKATPVVVGIWDSGVDAKVYPNRLFIDPAVPAQPTGDGPPSFPVDSDPHGLAFDLHSVRTHGELYPMGDNAKRLPELKDQIKGMLDIQAAIDSPEAAALKVKLASLKQEEYVPFVEDLGMFGNYIHGTHVAGIATEGNPFARVLIARLTFDYHVQPEKPTVELAKASAAAYQVYVDYFKKHNVRVVNMSWGGSLKSVEEDLEKNGVADPAERKKQAREIFEIDKNGLLAALKSAADILFVVSAGNSNNDVNFDEVIPSSFALPNLLTVGAVDQAGDETGFTSFGKDGTVYADGFEVESFIPGGTKLKLSGTSMSSPNVTNLAAKLFALDPKLTPLEVIALIKGGLETNAKEKRIQLINPKKSVELLKTKTAGK